MPTFICSSSHTSQPLLHSRDLIPLLLWVGFGEPGCSSWFTWGFSKTGQWVWALGIGEGLKLGQEELCDVKCRSYSLSEQKRRSLDRSAGNFKMFPSKLSKMKPDVFPSIYSPSADKRYWFVSIVPLWKLPSVLILCWNELVSVQLRTKISLLTHPPLKASFASSCQDCFFSQKQRLAGL